MASRNTADKDMSKVIVTGSSGLIGKVMVESLLNKGHMVIGIDTTPSEIKNDNFHHNNINMLINEKEMVSLLNNVKADYLVHLAYSMDNGLENPLDIEKIKDAVQVDDYLYKAANTAGIKEIFLLSTHQVYGHPRKISVISEHESEDPNTLYGELKVESEQTLINEANEGSFFGVIMRACPVYSKDYLKNVRARLYDESEGCGVVYGNGTYRMSFTHINNICQFVVNMIDAGPQKKLQGVYNICDAQSYSVQELFSLLRSKNAINALVQKKNPKRGSIFSNKTKSDYYSPDIAEVCDGKTFDSSKAKQVCPLSYSFTNLE